MVKKIFRLFNLLFLNIFILNYICAFSFTITKDDFSKESENIILNVSNISNRSAVFSWEYPENMKFSMGDYLNLIIIDTKIGEAGQIPVYSISHNVDNIDLKTTTTYEVNSLFPLTEYKGIIELVKSTGDVYIAEVTFTSEDFKISEIRFENVEENITNSKKVKLLWNVSDSNIKFNPSDSVSVFMKKFSDNDFFKNPIIKSTEPITKAELDIPNIEETYEFKIVYEFSGKPLESEIFFLDVYSKGIELNAKEITSSSVILKWNLLDKEILNDQSKVEFFLKENGEIEYKEKCDFEILGKNEILKISEHKFEGLKNNTEYDLKVKFNMENKMDFGEKIPIYSEQEFKFKTEDVYITDVLMEDISDNKCSLSWKYKGENVYFSKEDSLNVYIKEKLSTSYLQNPIQKVKLTENTKIEFQLPKFNTNYDIKLDMNIGGKHSYIYVSHIINIPKSKFKIKVKENKIIELIPEFSEKLKFSPQDKIKIFIKKHTEENYSTSPSKEVEVSSNKLISLSVVNDSEKHDLKIQIIKDGDVFEEKLFTVDVKQQDLQIVNVDYNKKNLKEIEANVEYAPYDFDFNYVETLTLFEKIKVNEKEEKKQIQNISENLKDNSKFNITLDELGSHDFIFEYKLKPKSIIAKEESLNSPNNENKMETIDPNLIIKTVTYEKNFYEKFDVFQLHFVDKILDQLKLGFLFNKDYVVKNGDNVKIYVKKQSEKEFSKDPIIDFQQGKDNIELDKIHEFDIVGLDHGTKYVFKSVFVSNEYKNNPIEKILEIDTNPINILDVSIKHISDITMAIKWKLGENFQFGPEDILNVYYKPEGSGSFSKDPNEVFKNLYEKKGEFLYLDSIDSKYDIKLVFQCAGNSVTKEFKVNTKLDDIKVKIDEIYETSAYVKWEYPKDYTVTDGESISIYVKESDVSEYSEETYVYMEQNENESQFLFDLKGIKLLDLKPNKSYDAKILFDLGELGKKEKQVSFKTKNIILNPIKITDLKPYEFNINSSLNSDTIDFNNEQDYLKVYLKNKDETWEEDKLIYQLVGLINKDNNFRISIDNVMNTYDLKIEYSISNEKITEQLSTELFYIDYEENENGNIDILFKYPKSVSFSDGDELVVFLKEPKEEKYNEKFSFKQTSSKGLKTLVRSNLKDVKQTSSISAYIKSKNVTVFPSEIIYDTRDVHSSTLEIVGELKGNFIDVGLPKDYELDTTLEILNSIGGESYYEKLDDGETVIVIDNLVPNKVYEETKLIAKDIYGNDVELFLGEFSLEPETLLEDFLYNSYFFAFDREPDEGGYNYWKEQLEARENISGRYFLINLMFAEKEFSDRNLSDEDLIKVLYQIVVNREYDQKGLSYWILIYKQYLVKFNGDKYEAKKTIVTRMSYEPEFERLCKEMGIEW